MKHQPVKSGTLFEKDLVHRVITQGVFVAAMTICAYWIGAEISGPYGRSDNGVLRAGALTDAARFQSAFEYGADLGQRRRQSILG